MRLYEEDMYRAAYSTPWVVMGRGSAPPSYTVSYYPEIIPYLGLDPSLSNMPLITSSTLDVTNVHDYPPKKLPWPNKQSKSCVNTNKLFLDNSSCDNEFRQYRSSLSPTPSAKPTTNTSSFAESNYVENDKCVRRSLKSSINFNYRHMNMYTKGVKRQLAENSSRTKSDDRSSSPCSDKDIEVLCVKKKYCNSPTPESRRKSINSGSSIGVATGSTRNLTPKRHYQEPCLSPRNLYREDEWDILSCEVWNKYLTNKQSDEKYNCKMRLHDVLHQLLLQHFPGCSLFVVGSSMNGFGCNTSDIDMCLMLQHYDIDQIIDAINILKHIQKILNRCDYVQKVELIRAKVPILKFKDSVSGCEVDLNINNSVGIRNTHLLHQYSKLDWRVRPLVLIIKMWARVHDINDAKNMTVSSYSLTLMVIHYLQAGTNPPVLPCLQKELPNKFVPDSDVKSLHLEENLNWPPSENSQSLGQLLVGFLKYYDSFQFSEQAISVRLGQRIPKYMCQFQKSRKNNPGQWKCLCIEEPFDLTNTARSVYDYDVFLRIEEVIKTSNRKLLMNKNLKSILL